MSMRERERTKSELCLGVNKIFIFLFGFILYTHNERLLDSAVFFPFSVQYIQPTRTSLTFSVFSVLFFRWTAFFFCSTFHIIYSTRRKERFFFREFCFRALRNKNPKERVSEWVSVYEMKSSVCKSDEDDWCSGTKKKICIIFFWTVFYQKSCTLW
jgi:hypothetical protein